MGKEKDQLFPSLPFPPSLLVVGGGEKINVPPPLPASKNVWLFRKLPPSQTRLGRLEGRWRARHGKGFERTAGGGGGGGPRRRKRTPVKIFYRSSELPVPCSSGRKEREKEDRRARKHRSKTRTKWKKGLL